MEVLPILNLPTTHEKVEQTAVKLGDLLREHPRYQRIMKAIIDLEKDQQVRDLSVQIQTKRNALYGGKGKPELAEELHRAEQELEALPTIQEYRAAEGDLRPFFHAVNALLSASLRMDFASNAKRGCGCGG